VPLANPGLKRLLRSPFLLDKAAKMAWTGAEATQGDERGFRTQCWRQVVRRDDRAIDQLPSRRARTFVDLALRRARALAPYVPIGTLDPTAMEELQRDSVVTADPQDANAAAPAHDVLEDWAVVTWLQDTYAATGHAVAALASAIDGVPAFRRGYRKWLAEMIECEPVTTDRFILAVFADATLPGYFRDDTMVSTLLSSNAEAFVVRQQDSLLDEDAKALVRVMHLLRVAGKKRPAWLPAGLAATSELLLPDGNAWAAVLKVVADHFDTLAQRNITLIVGFLEDWSRVVSIANPSPLGQEDAATIALGMIGLLNTYSGDGIRDRVMTVLAKIPSAKPAEFLDLLGRGASRAESDRTARSFAGLIVPGLNGYPACRAFPAEMAQLTTGCLCIDSTNNASDEGGYSPTEIEQYFGLKDHYTFKFFPSSAVRGPFLALLQADVDVGLTFVIDFANHAGRWYGERLYPSDALERAWQCTLTLPTGPVTQWINPRLWNLFRGTSVGPEVWVL
jgi:hypothetical protein